MGDIEFVLKMVVDISHTVHHFRLIPGGLFSLLFVF
jgi:hypothetical protein